MSQFSFDFKAFSRKTTSILCLFIVISGIFSSCFEDELSGPKPSIVRFSPSSGYVGNEVTIAGKNFSQVQSQNIVAFNGTPARVLKATRTKLTVIVPQGATTGPISVTVSGRTGVSADKFIVLGSVSSAEAVGSGGTDYDAGYSIAVDAAGNTYVTGSFAGTATFGTTALTSDGGSEDIFVAKYGPDMQLLWVTQAGGSGPDRGHSIISDINGNTYVAGYVASSTATFGSQSVTSNGGYDGFIAKYSTSGQVVWVSSYGGGSYDVARSLSFDDTGNLLVVGTFFETITIGTFALNSNGSSDVFVAEIDEATGNTSWAQSFGGYSDDDATSISGTDGGEMFIGAAFYGSTQYGASTFSSPVAFNGVIAKLSATGTLVWAKQLASDNWNNIMGVKVDGSGNCLATGYFTSVVDLGGTTLYADGNEDMFLAKYSPSGDVVWATQGGGYDYDSGLGLTVDMSDNIYVTGYFTDQGVFGAEVIESLNFSRDVFVARYAPSGSLTWVKHGGGQESDAGNGIVAGAFEKVYVTGAYRDYEATFGSGVLANSGGDDIFFWRIAP